MDGDGVVMIAFIVLLLFLGFVVGAGVGGCTGQESEQRSALEAGVARWTVDPATGETKFLYGCPKCKGR